MKKTMFILTVIAVSATSCKKEKSEPQQETPAPTVCSVSDNLNSIGGNWKLDTINLVGNDGQLYEFDSPHIGENVKVIFGQWFVVTYAENGAVTSSVQLSYSTYCDYLSLDGKDYSIEELTDSTMVLLQLTNPTNFCTRLAYKR